ncbi:hypothetical protein VSU19_13755 [Verrucomicrobiales bacterium BCK34]|nr:hypothetical protein [Verrucomicrobiales bacterium BCK34]
MKADFKMLFCLKRLIPSLLVASAFLSVSAQDSKEEPLPVLEKIDPIKLAAQRAALGDLTGEKPFILRESGWKGTINPGEARLVQIQLFRRNEYQFWLAMGDRKSELNLNIYDGEGQKVESEEITYDETNVVSNRVKPALTGVYYVRISLKTTIEDPQEWSMIYAYR